MRISDWSSDVCSSDLAGTGRGVSVAGAFVTGTDTGAGKTTASVALLHALRARGLHAVGMKPLASGCERDGEGRWRNDDRSEEHTSELQSLMRISYAVFCLKKKNNTKQ